MKKGGSSKAGGGCLCLGSPLRALSRACDSACNLYVSGMSGCARRVPTGAAAGSRGAGFGASGTAMYVRKSSDRANDLVRAATKQRRVAPEPADVGAATKVLRISQDPAAVQLLRKGAAMETIAEDAPCEFGACALRRPEPRRRGAVVRGLAARGGGFGAIKVGSEALPRQI